MLMNALALLGQVNDGSSFSFPEQASGFAERSDWLYHAIFWISLAFFVPIVSLMVYFCVKYRRREGQGALPSPSHNTWLEVTWTVVPTFLLMWMFWEGAWAFLDLRTPPDDAPEILVRAKQWSWTFTYPNGDVSDELHLPVNKPVKFRMRSDDVLHSFFIPEFRQKWDVIPGRFSYTWAKPIRTTTDDKPFRLYCAEYCGDSHSNMKADVYVHNLTWDEIYEKYTKYEYGAAGIEPWQDGEHIYKLFGCSGCHSNDGSPKTGPSFLGGWKTEQLTDKGKVVVDATYVRQSILEPSAMIRDGFKNQMPNRFMGRQLTEDEIEYVIAYLKHLNGDESPAAEKSAADTKAEASDKEKAAGGPTKSSSEKSADVKSTDTKKTDESK
jgi:cytochrome c oxidase subunit 2